MLLVKNIDFYFHIYIPYTPIVYLLYDVSCFVSIDGLQSMWKSALWLRILDLGYILNGFSHSLPPTFKDCNTQLLRHTWGYNTSL